MAVSPASIPLTLLLGLATGPLVWAPVSERYRHKPVLCAGTGLFLAASLWPQVRLIDEADGIYRGLVRFFRILF